MNLLKDLQKYIKSHHMLALIGIIVLAIVIMQYSKRKGLSLDNMDNNNKQENNQENQQASQVMPSKPMGENEQFASVQGADTQSSLLASCSGQPNMNPEELLPKDENNQWASLNPRGSGNLENINLLKAGWQAGINTVGSSLRNANLQLRSEPPNPQVQVSPWGNSTIEPDLMRVPLEIGSGQQ